MGDLDHSKSLPYSDSTHHMTFPNGKDHDQREAIPEVQGYASDERLVTVVTFTLYLYHRFLTYVVRYDTFYHIIIIS